MYRVITILMLLVYSKSAFAMPAFPPDYEKRRVIICSDIGGGDEDDIQSMIHFLVYSNMFDLEGIVISRPRGHISKMKEVIKAYKKDYQRLLFISPDYPTPTRLRQITKIGAERNKQSPSQGYSNSTPGSRLIVQAGRKNDPRPLYLMSWGSVTDIAQAIHDAPDIHTKLNIISGGTIASGVSGYNERGDPSPYKYLRSLHGRKFRLIECSWCGGGLYTAGIRSKAKYGNVGFVSQVIKSRGFLGKLFYKISKDININSYGIKMGDSAQVLYIFNGNFENPFEESWGGRYCKVEKNYFRECKQDIRDGSYNDYNSIVAKHRLDFLKDWEQRLIAIYDH